MICFSDLIAKNTIGEIGNILQNNFSTSGVIKQISGQACLIHACEKYFDYRMGKCGCGIEQIHFLGERKDWELIKEKINKLKDYDINGYLSGWIDQLEPTLTSFFEAYDGKINLDFWNSIVHKFVGYVYKPGPSGIGGNYAPCDFVNGWLMDFFLYDKKNAEREKTCRFN